MDGRTDRQTNLYSKTPLVLNSSFSFEAEGIQQIESYSPETAVDNIFIHGFIVIHDYDVIY